MSKSNNQRTPAATVPIVTPDMRMTTDFQRFLQAQGPGPSYTIASLPKPEVGLRVFVTDASGGGGNGVPAYGDGFNFRRYSDDTIIA